MYARRNKMETDYESEVEAQVEIYDDQIKALLAQVNEAPPEMREQLGKQIGGLIVNREELKRGFLELTDQGDVWRGEIECKGGINGNRQ
jgi:hypothetical protein